MNEILEKLRQESKCLYQEDAQLKIVDFLQSLKNKVVSPLSSDDPVQMPIEDVLSIHGRGTIVRGCIEAGTLKVGDQVDILGFGKEIQTQCIALEKKRHLFDSVRIGNHVGVLVQGVRPCDVSAGQMLVAHGCAKAYGTYKADIYLLAPEEGGRDSFLENYARLSFFFHSQGIWGELVWDENQEKVVSGEYASAQVSLLYQMVLKKGDIFLLSRDAHLYGVGVVTALC